MPVTLQARSRRCSNTEDIVRRNANISQCVFIREGNMDKKLMDRERSTGIMKHIWGENNFEKNCNKKEAENESN